MCLRAGFIDQQSLGGAADAGAAKLGVLHDGARHGEYRHRHARRHGRSPPDARKTGTRASSCTRATRLLPPRGTITSMQPCRPVSMAPTAARSRVGTIWTAIFRQARLGQPGGAWPAPSPWPCRANPNPRAGSRHCPPSGTGPLHPPSHWGGGSRRSRRSPRAGVATRSIFRPFGLSKPSQYPSHGVGQGRNRLDRRSDRSDPRRPPSRERRSR